MAKAILNPVMEQFRGSIGNLVFKRLDGEMVVGHRPDRTGAVATPAQESRFAKSQYERRGYSGDRGGQARSKPRIESARLGL
jgi:hypothetical protein